MHSTLSNGSRLSLDSFVSVSGRYHSLQIDRIYLQWRWDNGSRVRRESRAPFLGRGPRRVSQKEKPHSVQDSAWGVPISRVKSHPPPVRIICRQRSRLIARELSAIDLRSSWIVKRVLVFPAKTSRPSKLVEERHIVQSTSIESLHPILRRKCWYRTW